MIQKAILKNNWPLLDFFNLRKKYKINNNSNLFYFLLDQLEPFLIKNEEFITLEIINSDLNTSLFIKHFPVGIGGDVFTANLVDMSLKCDAFVSQRKLNPNKDFVTPTGLNSKDDISKISFNSQSLMLSYFLEKKYKFPLVITDFSEENFDFIEKIVETSNVHYLLLLNNNSGLFSSGNNNFRNFIAKKGLIFKSRIDGKNDFFVASDAINGFPRELFEIISTVKLQRLISLPPGGDFTRFK
jgi:hypothetical protein